VPPSWYNLQAYAFDKPVEYKKLLVYPAKMQNYFDFNICVQCFLLEKNTNLEGISKTYLEYLYDLDKKKDENQYLQKFDALLRLCLRKDDLLIKYGYNDIEKPVFIIAGEIYDSDDFNELRLLICEQNDVEIPDERIQKSVRDSMEETKRLRAKLSGVISPTIEDLVVCVMASTSYTLEEISNMSIRKFGQLVDRIDAKLHYQIFMTAFTSGFVDFKDKSVLKHWMSGKENDKWKGTTISVESLTDKLGKSPKPKNNLGGRNL
jgi:hypothetical protein